MNFTNAFKNIAKNQNNDFMNRTRDTWLAFNDKGQAVPLKEVYGKMKGKDTVTFHTYEAAKELAKMGIRIGIKLGRKLLG
jgi:hypothetical protein